MGTSNVLGKIIKDSFSDKLKLDIDRFFQEVGNDYILRDNSRTLIQNVQSTISDSPERSEQNPLQKDHQNESNRFSGIHAISSSLNNNKTNIISRNRTETKSIDAKTVKQPKKIQCRNVSVVLERLTLAKMNELLGIEPESALPPPARNIDYVSPRKNVTPQWTENLEQVQLENFQQNDFDVPMELFEDVNVPLAMDLSVDEMQMAIQTETDIQTYVRTLSSIISDQNNQFIRVAPIRPSSSSHRHIGSFFDSNCISYGPFVKYQSDTFAVNSFFHGNGAIQHHFLSKFCRSYLAALNEQFTGHLYTTEVTARLMRKYSRISDDHMHILTYGEKTQIGNALVTAIEVPYFPGGALFLFEARNQNKILHVGNFRLTSELDDAASLINRNGNIEEIRFDESILSSKFYQSPAVSVDRYMDLMNETYKFKDECETNGLRYVIAFGSSEIGMEFLIHRLAVHLNVKVYMSPERREFLECMELSYDDHSPVKKLLKILVTNPVDALVHVLAIEKIAKINLMGYIADKNYQRALGIRARGCDIKLHKLEVATHTIFDIANPLIGDIAEYERFIVAYTDKNIRKPAE